MRYVNFITLLFLWSTIAKGIEMPGRLIDVGGYKMHMYRSGKPGSPTVILDSFLGGTCLNWSLVQPHVSAFADVISYDRVGLGWSDMNDRERTSKNIVKELHDLLDRTAIHGPYILVGHSSGGINMRLFANTYPDEVFGVVLVDSSHEDQLDRFKEIDEKTPIQMPINICLKAPNELQKKLDEMRSTNRAGDGEWENFGLSMKQLKESQNQLENKPLIVITACKKREDLVELPSHKARMREYDKAWELFQKDFLKHSRLSKQVFAPQSTHYVMFDQPEIVVEAIRSMIESYYQQIHSGFSA